jgi:hypothetical protein
MSSKKNKILKKNLITFLTIFDGKPNILAEYLLQYDILDEKVIKLLINNKELSKKSKELKEKGEIEKPYFSSIEEMQEFYNKFFTVDHDKIIHPLLGAETQEEALIMEIKKAIEKEDYELAAKIRDYCMLNGIDLKKFLK